MYLGRRHYPTVTRHAGRSVQWKDDEAQINQEDCLPRLQWSWRQRRCCADLFSLSRFWPSDANKTDWPRNDSTDANSL